MINNPLNVPIRLTVSGVNQSSMRQAIQQIQAALSGGVNWSNTILGAANPNTHWRSRGMGFQSLAYMDRAIMGRGGMPGMLGRLGAGMLGFGGGVNSLPAMAVQAVQLARQQEQSYSDLNRRVGQSIDTYEKFREQIVRTGRDIGLTRQQILSLSDAYVSGVGRMSTSVMSNNLQGLMNLSKALGVDPSVTVGAATRLTRAGTVGIGGSTQPVNALMSTAIEMGGMRGRETETVKAIESLSDLMAQRLPTVSQQQMQNATMLMTVMNATGNQGLMGERGLQIMQRLDSFMQGSGGGVNKNLVFTALQMEAKRQGKGPMDLLSLETTAEQGIGSVFGLQSLTNMIGPGGLLPNSRITPLLMKYLGITSTASQAQALLPALMAVKGGAGGGFNALTSIMGTTNMNPAMMPYAVRALAGTDSLSNVLSDFSSGMSGSRREAFRQQALGVTSPQQAIELMSKFGDSTDALLTEQDKSTKVLTDFNNTLTDLATEMLPAVNGSMRALSVITGGVAGALSGLNSIVDLSTVTFATVAAVTGAQAVAGVVSGGSALARSGIFSRNPAGGIGPVLPGTGFRNGLARMAGPLSVAAVGAFSAYQMASQGYDPLYSIGRTGASILGSIGGGVLGSALGPLGTLGGSVAGGWAGDALFQKFFGDGVNLKDSDKLAQDSTLQQLLSASQAQLSLQVQPLSADSPWASGGYLDESSRLARRAQTAITAGGNPLGHRLTQGFHTGHPAIDLAYNMGEGISLPFAAKVMRTFSDSIGGNQLDLSGPGGAEIILAHLSSITAKAGQMISAGDVLGYAGATGNATGPHLHFEVRRPGTGIGGDLGAMDPLAYLQSLNLSGAFTVTVQDQNGNTVSKVNVPAGVKVGAYGNN